jgi:hypothetical protein
VNRGYIKYWRKTLDSGWLKNHKLYAFWNWCLLKATHKQHKQIVGRQEVHLQPGQFIFGRKRASEEVNLSEQEVRTILGFLKRAQNITIKSTNKFSIITVVNWHIYQGIDEAGQPSDQQTSNQPVTTNKNEKNEKNTDLLSTEPKPALATCPHLKIISLYNQILCPPLTPVKPSLWRGTRETHLQKRWREDPERQSIEWWEGLFKYIKRSCPFLMGKVTDFKADMGWIIKPENMVKVLEGKYEKEGTARRSVPGNGTGKPRVVDGMSPGSDHGKEPDLGSPPAYGGQGMA